MSCHLLRAILRQVAFLLTPEAPPFAHQLGPLGIDLHVSVLPLQYISLPTRIPGFVGQFAHRRTCRTTCSRFAAGGGSGLLGWLRSSIVEPWFESVCPLIDVLLCALLVHYEDALLPFLVGARDPETDVGDGSGIIVGNALLNYLDEDTLFRLVIESVCQLGLPLHLSEEEIGGTCHPDLTHLSFMNEFDGGVAELLTD